MSPHSSFELVKEQSIESLNATMALYRHKVTGAEHYHIAADFPENVFLVALRTIPTDSTGVAHVLEHTVLCGSKNYPVRDPFFLMSRRSLNSFMNAFTASDWTAYPFASEHEKDFDNLMDVYLDAVFFANLDKRDFHQEGHHLELDDDGKLSHQGVVYNEMIGAMQPVTAQLWETLSKALFPTSTYHFNSGGEPDQIAQLTYEQVKDFYQAHYHPSNAVFMTFGDRPVAQLQEKMHNQALSHFTASNKQISVNSEIRQAAVSHIGQSYATSDAEAGTHVVHAWLLPDTDSPEELLLAHLVSDLLLDHSASPLRQRLENSPVGLAPSPMCGVEDSMRDTLFVYGLEGVAKDDIESAHAYLIQAMDEVIEQGFSDEQVAAALHQLELMQREITGDGMPFGLQLMMQGLGAAIHRRDVFALLDVDSALQALQKLLEDPSYLPTKLTQWLKINQHKVQLTFAPDLTMADRQEALRAEHLNQLQARLTDERRKTLVDDKAALQARQAQEDDVDCLPSMKPGDVSPVPHKISATRETDGASYYHVGSNGISYRYAIKPLSPLDTEQQALLPLYAGVLTEVGCGTEDYLSMQAQQAQYVGSLSAGIQYRANPQNKNQWQFGLSLGGKALAKNTQALEQLMTQYQQSARFDEHQRIEEMVVQARLRREQSITNNGHVLAMSAASAVFSPVAAQSHKWNGIAALAALRDIEYKVKHTPDALTAQLEAMHQALQAPAQQLLLIDDQDGETTLSSSASQGGWLSAASLNLAAKQAYVTDTSVNFCARAFNGCDMTNDDSAALSVLAQVLKNGFLHSAVREQGGAYGGGASYDNGNGVFRFYSYRDPRLVETFSDFDKAVQWLHRGDVTQAQVDEGILSVISSLDKPLSPAGEARVSYFNQYFARSFSQQQAFRQRILACSVDDLIDVADRYLTGTAQDVVVCSEGNVPSDFDWQKI